jgi:UDP-GlcNAc3NAcA epimerase
MAILLAIMGLNIFVVVGTRPNFIKAAPLLQTFKRDHRFTVSVIHTGQHYDPELSQIFFEELSIPKPDFSLNIGSGPHGWQTGRMLEKLEQLFMEHRPDVVVVFGDVNSTLAGALAAAKLHIPVAHVEAGLRSNNKNMPEEINRIATDHISDYLFCPSKNAVKILQNEGITKGVHNVGDIMYDVLKTMLPVAEKRAAIYKDFMDKPYYLLTIHRASNTDTPSHLEEILRGVMDAQHPVVFPMHPRTQGAFAKLSSDFQDEAREQLTIIDPVGYLDILMLERNAAKILSDSGGMQKEAYFLEVPCITLREETEWEETLHDGWNILVGHDSSRIKEAIVSELPSAPTQEHYGSGNAADKIVSIIQGAFL